MQRMRFAPVNYDTVLLRGGWDQVTPTLSLKPGVVRDALNFECAPTGGYSRVSGYERFDGQPKPSDAVYQILQVDAFTTTPSVGDTITGNSSAATGVAVWVGSQYVAVTKVAGVYTVGEMLKVAASNVGTYQTQTVSITAKTYAQIQNAAADAYRSDITAVPGTGPVRGVFGMRVGTNDKVFAFRDNVGETSCDLYESTTSGWTKIDYLYEVYFINGSTAVPADGATLTQGGVTATVKRVVAQSGSTTWGGTTAGKFVITAPAGGNFAGGAATLSGGATCTLSAAQTQITVGPGGRVEADQGNYAGSAATIRTYGVDGVNRPFEFDGETYVPIDTGLTDDSPEHIACHKDALIVSKGSVLIYSGPGLPYRYGTVDGGGQLGVGDNVTNLLIQPGAQTTAALAVFCTAHTKMLYGTSEADWNLVDFNTGTGGFAYTAQNLANSFVFDSMGVLSLTTTLAYGNFQSAALTNNIRPFVVLERTKAVASTLARAKSQYRLFFSDGYGLYITVVNGKMLGAMPVYFPDPVNCAWEGRESGAEVMYFGDTAGFVHQLDVGSSFDGDAISAYVTLNWNAPNSPRILKRWRHASVEMAGNDYAEIYFGYQVGYGNTTAYAQPTATLYSSGFQIAPNWDSFTWDSFTWDGRTLFPTEVDMAGTSENFQVTISSETDYTFPYTVNSIITHYSTRRGLR